MDVGRWLLGIGWRTSSDQLYHTGMPIMVIQAQRAWFLAWRLVLQPVSLLPSWIWVCHWNRVRHMVIELAHNLHIFSSSSFLQKAFTLLILLASFCLHVLLYNCRQDPSCAREDATVGDQGDPFFVTVETMMPSRIGPFTSLSDCLQGQVNSFASNSTPESWEYVCLLLFVFSLFAVSVLC